jgi:hypothetical protein
VRTEALFADLGGNQKTSAFALTAVGSLFGNRDTPYLLASFATSDSVGWQRGWSMGAGWRFAMGGRNLFAESRVYSFHDPAVRGAIDQDWRYLWVPLSVGVRF